MNHRLVLLAALLCACSSDSSPTSIFDAPRGPDAPAGSHLADSPANAIDGPFATLPDAGPMPDSSITVGEGSFTCSIDGNSFTSAQTGFTYQSGILSVAANDAAGTIVAVTASVSGTGTLTVGAGNDLVFNVTVGQQAFVAGETFGSGTLNVTTFGGNRAAGTFSFVATLPGGGAADKHVTDGTFDIPVNGI